MGKSRVFIVPSRSGRSSRHGEESEDVSPRHGQRPDGQENVSQSCDDCSSSNKPSPQPTHPATTSVTPSSPAAQSPSGSSTATASPQRRTDSVSVTSIAAEKATIAATFPVAEKSAFTDPSTVAETSSIPEIPTITEISTIAKTSAIDLNSTPTTDASPKTATSLSPNQSSSNSSVHTSLSVGAVTGCVTGAIFFVVLVILGLWIFRRRRKQKRVAPSAEFIRRGSLSPSFSPFSRNRGR